MLVKALVPKDSKSHSESAVQNQIILYLFNAYLKAETRQNDSKDIAVQEGCKKIMEIIGQFASTVCKQPDIFEDQQMLSTQFLTILKNSCEQSFEINKFLVQVISDALSEDDDEESYVAVAQIFYVVFDEMLKQVKKASLTSLENWILPALQTCVQQNPKLAEILLKHTTPAVNSLGIKYAESFFGQLLCLSIMPKTNNGPYEYFDNLLQTNQTAVNNLSSTLWNYLNNHQDTMTKFFKSFLLLGDKTKNGILYWIGNALHANEKRKFSIKFNSRIHNNYRSFEISGGQIFHTHGAAMMLGINAPDSFMFGLSGILLRLCQPLFKPALKVMLVDPTYTAVSSPEELLAKQIHMKDMNKATCLMPASENRVSAEKYNFISEVFFMAHKSIDLGRLIIIIIKLSFI